MVPVGLVMPPLRETLKIDDNIDKIMDKENPLPRGPQAPPDFIILREIMHKSFQAAYLFERHPRNSKRRTETKFRGTRDMGKDHAGYEIGIEREQFQLLKPPISPHVAL